MTTSPTDPAPPKVVDLMQALEDSVAEAKRVREAKRDGDQPTPQPG